MCFLISRSLLILDLRCRFLIVVNLGLSLIKKSFISVFGFQGTKCQISFHLASGDGEIRTLDPLLARQVLSQLSYTPTDVISVYRSGLKWTRTTDLTLIRRAL